MYRATVKLGQLAHQSEIELIFARSLEAPRAIVPTVDNMQRYARNAPSGMSRHLRTVRWMYGDSAPKNAIEKLRRIRDRHSVFNKETWSLSPVSAEKNAE